MLVSSLLCTERWLMHIEHPCRLAHLAIACAGLTHSHHLVRLSGRLYSIASFGAAHRPVVSKTSSPCQRRLGAIGRGGNSQREGQRMEETAGHARYGLCSLEWDECSVRCRRRQVDHIRVDNRRWECELELCHGLGEFHEH